ncbi:MAG: dfp [Verrucomicrobiales bacterium]|nr:dfp [Verrucomicrobiales bacterium]
MNSSYLAGVNCIVTAGPTYEPLDEVRRLTNFSSGKLGSLLANFLFEQGHQVTLLLGHYSTFHREQKAQEMQTFTTTEDLRQRLKESSAKQIGAIFHAAAVSDFGFGKVFERQADGTLVETKSGKISTRGGALLAELVPTPKILRELRNWFPHAAIIGWKYEVDGTREDVIAKAREQILECKTTACVANGPAYGFGFGLVTVENNQHFSNVDELLAALELTATTAR